MCELNVIELTAMIGSFAAFFLAAFLGWHAWGKEYKEAIRLMDRYVVISGWLCVLAVTGFIIFLMRLHY